MIKDSTDKSMLFIRPCRMPPPTRREEWTDWAPHYGKYFVMIQACVDESGTHDATCEEAGSAVPVLGGYVASEEEWATFSRAWRAVLDDDEYKVDYFHSYKFNDRKGRKSNPESPYYGWSDEKAADFEFKLAEIAGRQIPLVGQYDLKAHNQKIKSDMVYPYAYPMDVFFRDMVKRIESHYPALQEKINFVMDQNSDKKWRDELQETARCYREEGNYWWIGKIIFADKKEVLPLQAADMIAFRARRIADRFFSQNQRQFLGVLDIMLCRNMRPKRSWRPTIPEAQFPKVFDLCEKYPSVKRALSENSAIYFRLENERRKRI